MKRRWWILLAVAALLGGAIAVSLPAWQRYRTRAIVSEAHANLRYLMMTAQQYFHQGGCLPGIDLDCREMPIDMGEHRRFPESVGPTPADLPLCEGGERVGHPIDPVPWQHPSWRALRFRPEEPQYMRYSVISAGLDDNARFTARVVGDLDCDGVLSTFDRLLDVAKEMGGIRYPTSRALGDPQ